MAIQSGIDLLDRQYEYLRAEIVQCIYLRHGAIVGMYSAIAAAIGVSLAQGKDLTDLATPGVVALFAVILAFLLNAFGALYLKEQARNRRCTLLNREIEKIITRLTCKTTSAPGLLAWENHIRSCEAEGYNRLYYASTVFGVGFPILLFTIPAAVIAQVALDPLIAGSLWQHPNLAYATCAWTLFAPTMILLIASCPQRKDCDHGSAFMRRLCKSLSHIRKGTWFVDPEAAVKRNRRRRRARSVAMFLGYAAPVVVLLVATWTPDVARTDGPGGKEDEATHAVFVASQRVPIVLADGALADESDANGDAASERNGPAVPASAQRPLLFGGNLLILLLGLRAWTTFTHISTRLVETDPAERTGVRNWIVAYLKRACGLDDEAVRAMLKGIRHCPRNITTQYASELKPLWDELLYGGE